MDILWLYAIITSLILFVLVVVLRVMERTYPKIKYISVSSIIPFVLVLLIILIKCSMPYNSWVYCICGIFTFIPFLLPYVIWLLFNAPVGFEDTIQFSALVVAFVLYTLLIFLVIRIILNRKRRCVSGNAFENRIK